MAILYLLASFGLFLTLALFAVGLPLGVAFLPFIMSDPDSSHLKSRIVVTIGGGFGSLLALVSITRALSISFSRFGRLPGI